MIINEKSTKHCVVYNVTTVFWCLSYKKKIVVLIAEEFRLKRRRNIDIIL